MILDLNEIRKKNKLHSSRAVRPEEIDAMLDRIEELQRLNAELVKSSLRDWLKSPAFQTFIDLKHGPIGTILMLLQEGQISRGKCAEALAELAHGIAPEDVRLPAFSESMFTDDQTPAEVCAAKDAEIESLRKTLEAVREKVESAPHYEECQSDYTSSSEGLPDPCDCWKAPALSLIDAALKPKEEEHL